MQRLYYMHPINTYGTELEQRQLALIAEHFPDWEIVNPNTAEHQENCQRIREAGGNYMQYFEKLAASCQGGVALPFRDGKFGAGVYKEMESLAHKEYPVWILEYNAAEPYLFTWQFFGDTLILDVAETRARIRNKDGSTKPY